MQVFFWGEEVSLFCILLLLEKHILLFACYKERFVFFIFSEQQNQTQYTHISSEEREWYEHEHEWHFSESKIQDR